MTNYNFIDKLSFKKIVEAIQFSIVITLKTFEFRHYGIHLQISNQKLLN